ncbi:MAG: tRNA dimethylallyltransferase [Parcubacteria bacterium C7867-003]|nr:MAG: tRNA dimethylallyltransferase [Parcubacteria bacterium C7867-003]
MKNKTKNKILIILGQTATGKSSLAVQLAKKYNGEVISADSRQVYKGLDIGTGKITKKEMKGIPHHMLDVVKPQKTFTVAQWQKQTEKIINKILSKNKLPIICGGTGFYIQSIVDGLVLPVVLPNKKLRMELETKSREELQNILNKLDPNRFKTIDINNPVRLIRAIEIAKELGSVPEITKKDSSYKTLQIGLKVKDQKLKNNIYKRIISRIKKGMVKEAENLHKNGLSYRRMEELGLEYRLLSSLIQNKISKKEFVLKLEKEIWQYAKRQMVWFKKDKTIKWFEPKEISKIEKVINSFLD